MGHIMMASYSLKHIEGVDELWFVVSPQSPFKRESYYEMPFSDRVEALRRCVSRVERMHVCDIEGRLPLPSYTHRTLKHLKGEYPDYEFALLMGDDTYIGLPLWRQASWILENFTIYVYPRSYVKNVGALSARVIFLEGAPRIEISSTMVREWIRQGKLPDFFVPEEALRIINEKNYFSGNRI